MKIECFDTTDRFPLDLRSMEKVVLQLVKQENSLLDGEIRIIFVDDARIRLLNKEFLDHDYETDVLSFLLDTGEAEIDGEIYVSLERAEDQAEEYNVSVQEELWRLTFHGVLHLLGYDDRDEISRSKMREKEDYYLHKFFRNHSQ